MDIHTLTERFSWLNEIWRDHIQDFCESYRFEPVYFNGISFSTVDDMLTAVTIFLIYFELLEELILVEAISHTAHRHRMMDLRCMLQVGGSTEIFDHVLVFLDEGRNIIY